MGRKKEAETKMHPILIATHKKENIDILKARDYFFDKARKENNVYRKLCLLAPIIISVVGMFLGTVLDFSDTDEWLDITVGVTAIAAFVIELFLQKSIDDNMEKSNVLREEYDCRVLGIKKNPFYGNNSDEEIKELIKYSSKMPDTDKYEVWYRETFSNNDYANAICMAMDNTIYTFHVYRDFKKQLIRQMALLGVGFLAYLAWFELTPDDYYVAMVTPFLLFIALFDVIKALIESFIVSNDLEKSNRKLNSFVKKHSQEILSIKNDDKAMMLRSIEDIVYYNRSKSLFIPKRTRYKYLDNINEYYRDLDEIKTIYWEGEELYKPKDPSEFLVPGTGNITLEDIHGELNDMLVEVKKVFDENGIRFMLDGGTLLGACRNQSFLPWDDDVDIAFLSEDDANEAINIINSKLEGYEVQDYSSEYYSPRLSRFRIRKKNPGIIVDEKDSELYELYADRGLFIDAYTYSPIIKNRFIDFTYRMIFFCRLNNRIRKIEQEWKTNDEDPNKLTEFNRLREIYLKRYEKYKERANCKDYYAYEPFYMEKGWKFKGWLGKVINEHYYLKHCFKERLNPAIYIEAKAFNGEGADKPAIVEFEGYRYLAPCSVDSVLSAYYGKNWKPSPYKDINRLEKTSEGIIRFSRDTFDATNYKHIKAAYRNSVD